MKEGIHPENYRLVAFKDMSNDDVFITKSTVESKDSIEELKISADQEIDDYYPNIFTLIPNINKLKSAEKYEMTNFAFLTSVSNSFQKRNINRT